MFARVLVCRLHQHSVTDSDSWKHSSEILCRDMLTSREPTLFLTGRFRAGGTLSVHDLNAR